MMSSLHHWCHSLHEWFVVQYLQIIYKYRLISSFFFFTTSTSTNFCYNNQLSTILSNHIPSTLYNIYTLFSLNFVIIINLQLSNQPSNSPLSLKPILVKGMFFYLCYLCSSVSMCVLTILYITAIFQVIYTSIIMTNLLNQDLASYMW
jgi:hypothetical protein